MTAKTYLCLWCQLERGAPDTPIHCLSLVPRRQGAPGPAHIWRIQREKASNETMSIDREPTPGDPVPSVWTPWDQSVDEYEAQIVEHPSGAWDTKSYTREQLEPKRHIHYALYDRLRHFQGLQSTYRLGWRHGYDAGQRDAADNQREEINRELNRMAAAPTATSTTKTKEE